VLRRHAAEQGDEADEAFGGTVARIEVPPHARAAPFLRGHRFAAYPQCSADPVAERGNGVTRARVGFWAAVVAAAVYLTAWGVSLTVALQDHADEVLGPNGHGALEAAVATLVGITQPLGLLAGLLLTFPASSGKAGIVVVWCVAGALGAVQWVGVAAVARAVWNQFRPTRTALHIK
jgi:hypothetical protein